MPAASQKTAKKGKENVVPKKSSVKEDAVDDSFDTFPDDEEPAKKSVSNQATKTSKAPSKSPVETSVDEDVTQQDDMDQAKLIAGLQKKNIALAAETDKLRKQRDVISKQFEELSKIRSTDSEALFERYKAKSAIQAQAQNDIISNLTTLNDKQQAKILDLEKRLKEAALPPPKADPKEVRQLKEELAKVKSVLQSKDEKISSLEREYKAEVEHSRSLQAAQSKSSLSASTHGPSASNTGKASEESEIDNACLRLYEDLTELNVANVKIKDGGKSGKEIVFNCIQTHAGKSINFKLRSFNTLDNDLVKSKSDNPWVKRIAYNPEGLEYETDQAFKDRLEPFDKEFSIPRDQLPSFFDELKGKLADE